MNRIWGSWGVLAVIVAASGALGVLLLTTGHDWGDDFAAYILQATSVVNGNPSQEIQRSIFTIQQSSYRFSPFAYPWGFPLMLAPVYALFGLNIFAFKLTVTMCYLAFLIACCFLYRTRLSDGQALILTAFLAFNLALVRSENEVLSDLPFLLWSTLVLWLMERNLGGEAQVPPSAGSEVAIGLAAFLAVATRPNGWLLLVPMSVLKLRRLIHAPVTHRGLLGEGAGALIPYVVVIGCYVVLGTILPNLAGGYLDAWQQISWRTISENLVYYGLLGGALLQASMPGGFILYFAFLGLSIAALRARLPDELGLLSYSAATVALYLAFPQVQGQRYLFPVVPILILFAFEGSLAAFPKPTTPGRSVPRMILYGFWIGLVVTSLIVSIGAATTNIRGGRADSTGPLAPASVDMFAYIRTSTPKDSVIVFYKPRALRLFTNRNSLLATSCDDLARGNFVVMAKSGTVENQLPPPLFDACKTSLGLVQVYTNLDFDVYREIGTQRPGPSTGAGG